MSAAPREYQSLLIGEQSRIGLEVTMDDLESAMTKMFRANSHMRNAKEGKELALTGMTCFSCGKEGHKSYQCKDKDQNQGGRGGRGGRGCSNAWGFEQVNEVDDNECWNSVVRDTMGYKRSQADPCLYYKWMRGKLILWVSWVHDCLFICPPKMKDEIRKEMTTRFDCDIIGNMDEYVGCKIERNNNERWVKITQPVILQSFVDQFELLTDGRELNTPGEPGQSLVPCGDAEELNPAEQTKYRSGVGKLLHVMRWSRPDILNAVRDLWKYMKQASKRHMQALHCVMRYCIKTELRATSIDLVRHNLVQ